MTTKIIPFPTASRADRQPTPRPAPKAASGPRTRPSASLALILRAAPPELQPAQVAADLLATGSNAAAGPVWTERKAAFQKLVAPRRLSVLDRHRLKEEWRAAIGVAGIELKARKRAERIAAVDYVLDMLDRDAPPHRA